MKRMKCAIIEFNRYHDEVIPTFIHILNRLGYVVDVYTSGSNLSKNIFELLPEDNYRLSCIASGYENTNTVTKLKHLNRYLGSKLYFKREIDYSKYDFVIFNSIEPVYVFDKIAEINCPSIAVIHNLSFLELEKVSRFFSREIKCIPIVLAKHLKKRLDNFLSSFYVTPVYLGPYKNYAVDEKSFCAQGNFQLKRRNYQSMIDGIEYLAGRGYHDFKVRVIGNHRTKDFYDFNLAINNRQAKMYMEYPFGTFLYKDYLNSISSNRFILPLIDKGLPDYEDYINNKITSSVNMALGLNIIPILTTEIAHLYELEDFAIMYDEPLGLGPAMLKGLLLDDEARAEAAARIEIKKNNFLTESQNQLQEALRYMNG